MKHDKNMRFCMDQLNSMLNRNGFDPEQKRALEAAQRKLRALWRKNRPGRSQIFQVVREVAEAILTILKRD